MYYKLIKVHKKTRCFSKLYFETDYFLQPFVAQKECVIADTAPSHDNRCPVGHHFFIVCHSGHTSAALRCTRLLPNLRPADAHAGCDVASAGCPCGGGYLRTPVRDVAWHVRDARVVADTCGRPCGMWSGMCGMPVWWRIPADTDAGATDLCTEIKNFCFLLNL